jgi:hypothetical protein
MKDLVEPRAAVSQVRYRFASGSKPVVGFIFLCVSAFVWARLGRPQCPLLSCLVLLDTGGPLWFAVASLRSALARG